MCLTGRGSCRSLRPRAQARTERDRAGPGRDSDTGRDAAGSARALPRCEAGCSCSTTSSTFYERRLRSPVCSTYAGLVVLATSREPLHQAEQRCAVEPLRVPADTDPAAVERAPAGALFADRARSQAATSSWARTMPAPSADLPPARRAAARSSSRPPAALLGAEELNARLGQALDVPSAPVRSMRPTGSARCAPRSIGATGSSARPRQRRSGASPSSEERNDQDGPAGDRRRPRCTRRAGRQAARAPHARLGRRHPPADAPDRPRYTRWSSSTPMTPARMSTAVTPGTISRLPSAPSRATVHLR